MNKKVTIIAMVFMFFISTCASFAELIVPGTANVGTSEVAQHHRHHKKHEKREDYRRNKRVCPPHCRCIRDGFCRPSECSVKCRCYHCKIVPRHTPHPHKHHNRHHDRY